MNNITLYLNELVRFTGLPLWTLLILSVLIIFSVYLYGILIPLSVRRIKKEIINMNHKFGILVGEQDKGYKTDSTYKWKS